MDIAFAGDKEREKRQIYLSPIAQTDGDNEAAIA